MVRFVASVFLINLVVFGCVSTGAAARAGEARDLQPGEGQFLTVMNGKGRIAGIVIEGATGKPIPYANVVLVGTRMGAMSLTDGTFVIEKVPAGIYTVKVMMMGYAVVEKEGVKVKEGRTIKLEFKMKETIVGQTQEILVEAEVKQIEVKDSDMSYKVSKEEFEQLPVDDVVEAIALKGGIVKTGDDLHVRGGRRGAVIADGSSPSACMPRRDLPPYHNTEEYAHIEENRFHSPVTSPLSTFSIDVDAASYANVRRFIMGGSFPYRDAVRVEELVNYFDYDYMEPKGDAPFSINLEYSDCPWNGAHRLAHIGLQGKHLTQEERSPSNIVFLIDVSGSMGSPNKLPLLKDAFKLLVGQLADDDQVSIVVYAGSAGLVLPPTRGFDKRTIKDAIDRLHSGGSTAGGEGIRLAYRIAAENFIEEGNNRVILATDGDFNVGISSTSELVEYIESKRDEGIFLTVLGFGMGNYKDGRLEQLADKGNGNHAYIDNIMEAKKVFVNEVTGTLYTIAKDVKIQVEFNPARVASYRLIGYENRRLAAEDFRDDRKDAGEIGAGHTVTALYEIVPAGTETAIVDELRYQDRETSGKGMKSDELMLVKIRYKEPDGEVSREIREVMRDEPRRFSRTSDDFRFSAAVAMFGMVLRRSEHMGDASLDKVIEIAREAKGKDPFQYRAEFITIAERAQTMVELGEQNEAMNR
ncbi:MAG TPA: von Willebrand factor type A domain-containing protein [Candidatus Krumholzibacterium sp.]|nr:von Willebrand factor type A domain-containing protein [Candidatus Krumholzibacterium sp.]